MKCKPTGGSWNRDGDEDIEMEVNSSTPLYTLPCTQHTQIKAFHKIYHQSIFALEYSFCAQCVNKEISQALHEVSYLSEKYITIPESGVNVIPQNLHLGFEVEVAGYMSKIGSA